MAPTNDPFRIEPVRFSSGWRGRVLVRWPDLEPLWPSSSDSGLDAALLPSLEAFLEPDAPRSSGVALKSTDSLRVVRADLPVGGETLGVVVKERFASGPFGWIAHRAAARRAGRTFDLAVRLLKKRIPTALPLAVLHRGGASLRVMQVTREIKQAMDLERVCSGFLLELAEAEAVRVRCRLARLLADLFRRMSTAGVRHRDFKASNVLVTQPTTDRAAVWLIDLDGISIGRPAASSSVDRGVVRLVASLLDAPSVGSTDLLRFLKHLIKPESADSRRPRLRTAFRDVLAQAAEYNARSRSRKRGKIDGYVAR